MTDILTVAHEKREYGFQDEEWGKGIISNLIYFIWYIIKLNTLNIRNKNIWLFHLVPWNLIYLRWLRNYILNLHMGKMKDYLYWSILLYVIKIFSLKRKTELHVTNTPLELLPTVFLSFISLQDQLKTITILVASSKEFFQKYFSE